MVFKLKINDILFFYNRSVMNTIHNVIRAHSDHWECFKYSVLNNDNSLEIRYDFTDEKPKVYQTRNMYPKVDTTRFDKLLNDIIAGEHLLIVYFFKKTPYTVIYLQRRK